VYNFIVKTVILWVNYIILSMIRMGNFKSFKNVKISVVFTCSFIVKVKQNIFELFFLFICVEGNLRYVDLSNVPVKALVNENN